MDGSQSRALSHRDEPLQRPVDWRAEDESGQDEESLLKASRQSLGWRIPGSHATSRAVKLCPPPQWGGTELGGDWRRLREALKVVLLNCLVLGSLLLESDGEMVGAADPGRGHSPTAVPPADATLGSAGGGLIL